MYNIFFIDALGKLSNTLSTLNTISIIFRMLLAIILGSIIGFERSSKRHSAGLRTFILITLMGTMTMLLDLCIQEYTGSSLFILSGCAILGSVVICGNSILFSSKKQIKGLTTSAGLWTCQILGIVIGLGYYLISILLCAILIIILAIFPKLEMFLKDKSNHFEIHLELNDKTKFQDLIYTLRKLNIQIDDIELNNSYFGSGLSVYTISLTDVEKKYSKHSDIINGLKTLEYVSFIEEIR